MPPILILVCRGVITPLRREINTKPDPREEAVVQRGPQRRISHHGVVAARGSHREEDVDVVGGPRLGVNGVDGGLLDGLKEGVVEVHLADVGDVASCYGAVWLFGYIVVDHCWGVLVDMGRRRDGEWKGSGGLPWTWLARPW